MPVPCGRAWHRDQWSRRGFVGPLLAAEVDFLVPSTASRRWLLTAAPGLEALQARPGFDQRSIDREMIVGQKPLELGLR
jgi:hypothetical protein